jgi:5-formyltetrahydrofolate cyclo-ligase
MAVPSHPLPADKATLRAEGLRRRRDFARSLDDETRAALERNLAQLVLPHLLGARVIAAYHPLRDEISPYPILAGLGEGQRWALPWFAHRDTVFLWREGPARDPSPWGVAQPGADAAPLAPDVVLVPVVLADRQGVRIGHGKGHYDRALANLKAGGQPVTTIGLAWPEQLVDGPLPADSWDMRLDAVATPGEWVSCA